jgi:hypothetical protein
MPPVHLLLQWRLLMLSWLIVWVASVPFFHLHFPDNTDRWSSLRSGGAHTVFTPDLPGEFSLPFTHANDRRSAHLSLPVVNSPELSLVLSEQKSNNHEPKPSSLLLYLTSVIADPPLLPGGTFTRPRKRGNCCDHIALHASRAPPLVLFS